jgi:hypothetical protein
MSFDRQINQICTHEVVEEALFLSPDRVTVRPLRPISNSNSVKVRINGVADILPVGLNTPAIGKGALPGPFNIRPGVNDQLVVSVNAGPDQVVTVPSGREVSAKSLAQALTGLVSGVVFETTRKNQIQIKSYKLGKASQIMFKSGSTVAGTLGLQLNKAYRGQQVFPAWSLVHDPNTLRDRPTRLIVFDEPIDGTNDYLELNYSTIRQECRRCGGAGVENDWRFNGQGEVIKVRDGDLLIQESLKITYTVKGTNPFHSWYGTLLLDMIGKKMSDRGLVQNLILSDIQDAFRRWQSIKKQQEQTVGQFVSDEEYPFRLLVVNLEPDASDPTILYINAQIQSRSSRPVQVTRGLKLPLPFDILESTVQDALLRQDRARNFLG